MSHSSFWNSRRGTWLILIVTAAILFGGSGLYVISQEKAKRPLEKKLRIPAVELFPPSVRPLMLDLRRSDSVALSSDDEAWIQSAIAYLVVELQLTPENASKHRRQLESSPKWVCFKKDIGNCVVFRVVTENPAFRDDILYTEYFVTWSQADGFNYGVRQ